MNIEELIAILCSAVTEINCIYCIYTSAAVTKNIWNKILPSLCFFMVSGRFLIPCWLFKNPMKDPFKMNSVEGTNISCNMQEGKSNCNQRLGSILLNEFNYFPWSRAMTIAFGRRSKPSYVNSHISPLKSPSQAYEAWQCKNQLVISWLFYSMKNRIAEIFSY